MSTRTYESVDLTEDEDSNPSIVDGVVQGNNPFQFVDCSAGNITNNTNVDTHSMLLPPLTPIANKVLTTNPSRVLNIQSFPIVSTTLERTENVGMLIPSTVNRKCIPGGKSIETFSSVQIKPPSLNKTVEPQYVSNTNRSKIMETVYIDSDDEDSVKNTIQIHHPRTSIPLNSNMEPTQVKSVRPPGKMVLINKNNKYYKIVIPYNIVPSMTGPVIINIPEIGPLAISTDLNSKQQILKLINNNTKRLCSNSPVKLKQQMTLTPKEIALYDKKFCWTLVKGKKRDLEGFTCTDRLGFQKVEYAKARKCYRTLEAIINNKNSILLKKMGEYSQLKKELSKNLVKVHNNPQLNEMKKKQYEFNYTEEIDSSTQKNSGFESDLLLTKKVVILNENNREVEIKNTKNSVTVQTRKKNLRNTSTHSNTMKRKRTQKHNSHNPKIQPGIKQLMYDCIKPCYVDVNNEEVENFYKNQCIADRVRSSKTMKQVYIPVTDNSMEVSYFEKTLNLFKSKMITTNAKFISELHYIKPLLIVNEYNIFLRNYSKDYSKFNIVYIVKDNRAFPLSLLKNFEFVRAVSSDYVKLIDCKLFCQYIMDKTSFSMPQEEEYISEEVTFTPKTKHS